MEKIRLCLYSENVSPGATIHHIKNIAKYIDRDKFEIFFATADVYRDCYFPELAKYFKPQNILTHPRTGRMYDYDPASGEYYPAPDQHPLYEFLEQNQIDIIHDQRGGGTAFPLNAKQIKALKVDTNIFGGDGTKDGLVRSLLVSNGTYNEWQNNLIKKGFSHFLSTGQMVYLAVDYPETDQTLRRELGISEDIIVMGRMSMGYAGDHINFEAYKNVENRKTLFLTPFLNEEQKGMVKKLGIRNIVILPLVTNYLDKSKTYNTFDIAVHHRGESFGAFVAEAMMHSKPVVTVGWSNGNLTASTGQEELIGDPRFCAMGRNHYEIVADYTKILSDMIKGGRDHCRNIGQQFRKRAESMVAAPMIVKQLESIYLEIAGKTNVL